MVRSTAVSIMRPGLGNDMLYTDPYHHSRGFWQGLRCILERLRGQFQVANVKAPTQLCQWTGYNRKSIRGLDDQVDDPTELLS